jgi:uncharacterized membrane protein
MCNCGAPHQDDGSEGPTLEVEALRLQHETAYEDVRAVTRPNGDSVASNSAPAVSSPEPAERNVSAVAEIEREALHERSKADRIADAITRFTGSAPFAIFHVLWFAGWAVVNVGMIAGVKPFDPFPFSFLTLLVSLEAIFLSMFVLMSQNRMSRQADKRAHLDLQIDLLAEQELTTILRMLRALCAKQGVQVNIPSEQMREQLKDTDVHSLASALSRRLPE